MRVDVVGWGDLSDADLAAWRRIRAGNPALDSPYFHPDFTAAVHHTWHDVQVIVVRGQDGAPRWLLPIRSRRGEARPAGSPAMDFQAPIAAPGEGLDPLIILRSSGLKALAFDHLLDRTPGFAAWVVARHHSPLIDVTGGIDGYLERASATGRQNIQQARRRIRKAEGELGPLRFVAESDDASLLATVVRLKRAQYAATGVRDYFRSPGRREFLDVIADQRGREFGGMLSGLYAGERLLAAHFGIRSDGVLHWWFPVYDPELARFGPGWILLRQLIESSPQLGIDRIDLGRGDDEYKRRAKTDEVIVCESRVELGTLRPRLRSMVRQTVASVRSSRVGPPLVGAAKRARHLVHHGSGTGARREHQPDARGDGDAGHCP